MSFKYPVKDLPHIKNTHLLTAYFIKEYYTTVVLSGTEVGTCMGGRCSSKISFTVVHTSSDATRAYH